MKKFIFIFCLFLIGCHNHSIGRFDAATYYSQKVYVGMSINEFRELVGIDATLEAMDSGYTVYKLIDINPWGDLPLNTRFFYFDSVGKLYRVDGGQFKQERYQIEVVDRQ